MRVLTVLEILQTKGTVTTDELVRRLEVSDRTVQRYIARLQDLGVPVTATRGRGAAYRLERGFRMQPLMFNDEEALAVALGLKAMQQMGIASLAPAVSGVEAKLERVLPDAIWQKVRAVGEALHIAPDSWLPVVDSMTLAELTHAIQARMEIAIRYVNREKQASDRIVRPLGLMRDNGAWFLAAYCLMRQDLRLFRVDRIDSIKRTQHSFEVSKDFDMKTFIEEKFASLPAAWHTEVWVDATVETLNYAILPTQSSIQFEDGGVMIRCNINNLEAYAAVLLALNSELVIRTPNELKAAFGQVAQRALAFAQSD